MNALVLSAVLDPAVNDRAALGTRRDAAEPTGTVELMQIYKADQKDREAPTPWVDRKLVGPRDVGRRNRVRELIEHGGVRTGKDYERAGTVFQHRDTPEDILFVHVLAATVLGKDNAGPGDSLLLRWIGICMGSNNRRSSGRSSPTTT